MTYDDFLVCAGFKSLHADCSVERFDGIDLDAALRSRLRSAWYELLDTADPALLPTADYTNSVTTLYESDCSVTIALPPGCRRLTSIRLRAWRRPAEIICNSDGAYPNSLGNPYAQPGYEHPIALRRLNTYELFPKPAVVAIPVSGAGAPPLQPVNDFLEVAGVPAVDPPEQLDPRLWQRLYDLILPLLTSLEA